MLGKSTAKDILGHFEKCLGELGKQKQKLIQASSNGPNVIPSFLRMLQEKRNEEELPAMIDLGICGLHTVHNGLKHGENASGWQTKKLLSLHKIFHEAPGRRADFKTMADATEKDYPMQFMGHRWVEKKARMVWEKMVIITNYWCQLPKSKQPSLGKPGNNTSFDHLRKAVKDPLIPIKVLFFEEVARKLDEFLAIFQTDQPMAAFLVETLQDLLLSFMEKFVPKSILEKNS